MASRLLMEIVGPNHDASPPDSGKARLMTGPILKTQLRLQSEKSCSSVIRQSKGWRDGLQAECLEAAWET